MLINKHSFKEHEEASRRANSAQISTFFRHEDGSVEAFSPGRIWGYDGQQIHWEQLHIVVRYAPLYNNGMHQ